MDLKPEIEILALFQSATRSFIDAVNGRIDHSWSEISKNFDSDKLRQHEEFVGLFSSFIDAFDKIDEIEETLRYFHEDNS